jgi:hypothetical protein
MNRPRGVAVTGGCVVVLWPAAAGAQFRSGSQTVVLTLPTVSQRAVAAQRIGLTDITVVYHRPHVKGRKIFGEVVPYGRVWRAGANDNTTIEFQDPISIEGQALAAGRYGLHMIPGPEEWTVIFSKNSTSWGSFSYDPSEDALRVKVKPSEGPFRELLTYEFTELESDAASLVLEWERVVVPLKLGVDVKQITLRSIRNQLRHLPGFTSDAWNDAALYCLDNRFNYDEALEWINHSIQQDERFENLSTKAQLLEALGRSAEAAPVIEKALAMASAAQAYQYADGLMRDKRVDEAVRIFLRNQQQHPEAWIAWVGLARAQVVRGDRSAAARSLREALTRTPGEAARAMVQRLIQRLDAGEDIA